MRLAPRDSIAEGENGSLVPVCAGSRRSAFGHWLPVGWTLWMARSLGLAVTRCFCVDVSADLISQPSSMGEASSKRLDESFIPLAALCLSSRKATSGRAGVLVSQKRTNTASDGKVRLLALFRNGIALGQNP